MIHAIEIIFGLLVAVAGLALLAHKMRVAYPILFVIGGLVLGFIPGLPRVRLDPELVFLLFLPPLLYPAALLMSWRDFRANLRPIGMLAIRLVLVTTVVIALVAHKLLGLPWAAAFVLGAIVSPPDAVAATAITQRLHVPRHIVTILEGESLVNDATALAAPSCTPSGPASSVRRRAIYLGVSVRLLWGPSRAKFQVRLWPLQDPVWALEALERRR